MKQETRNMIMVTMLAGTILTACDSSDDSSDESIKSDSTSDLTSVATMETFTLTDTGQDICADEEGEEIDCPAEGEDYYGQDAQFDSEKMSYSDNGDNTVTDNVTELMWQQEPSSEGFSYDDAVDYCSDLTLADYSDWRIPTTKELFSISDFQTGWPYLDTSYFYIVGDSVSKDEQYWTEVYVGTTTEGGDNAAFGVNHGTGHIKAYPASVSGVMGNYVRCVRGDYYGVNDFENNGDGTVTDHASGLMWEESDDGSGMEWSDALVYAEEATTGGYSDWRLPNIKELQSIVDYSKSPSATDDDEIGPAIDLDYFNITEYTEDDTNYDPDYGYFWSNTNAYFNELSTEYYYAWYVAFGTAVDDDGEDLHGAGAVRFDTKYEGGEASEDGERYYNFVRLVRDVD